jgi:hypothetical protein
MRLVYKFNLLKPLPKNKELTLLSLRGKIRKTEGFEMNPQMITELINKEFAK